MKTFDLANSPLSGINLIEASAGTGKTYTIAGLFLRLILEKQLLPEQILVVTFTKAATAELKDRIRNKLTQAKTAFLKGSSPDIFIGALIQKHQNQARALQLLQDALVDFDKAAVYTIHGFCQRILHENAFETRSLFDTELVTDPSRLTHEIADDFWRKHFYNMPPEFISYAFKKVSGPKYFIKLLAHKKTPEIKIIPELTLPALASLDDYRKICRRLRSTWSDSKERVLKLLKDPALSGTIYGSLKAKSKQTALSRRDLKVLSMAEAMDRYVDTNFTTFPLFKDFEKFTSIKLSASTRKNHVPPTHAIFDICDELFHKSADLEAEMEKYFLFLKAECFKFADRELATRKEKTNIQFFDDLLLTVKKALADQDGSALTQAIRHRYKAALVDEFQDTDTVQYAIFSRIFASKQSALFMIGDPKQSIYSFRGADIFSYMKASRQADSKYTLIENWRSNPRLITAINTIFSNIKTPFVFNEIPFEEGVSGKKSAADKGEAPLTIWYLLSDNNKPINKAAAISMIARAVAAEISRIIAPGSKSEAPLDPALKGGACRARSGQSDHGREIVKPGDIAVLVRTNRQAQIIKDHISAKRIPAVLYSAGNIFDSHEALEMERILAGIAEPGNERLLRSALVTDLLGVPGQKIDSQSEDPLWWETRFGAFRRYCRLWQQYGFIRMFRLFMAREKVRGRLLTFPDGERRLTNVLHLAEILHQESVARQPGITGLIKWLSAQRHTEIFDPEVHQLRLESDEQAVKIVTIHKSKGLEYPIVFCPFGWEGSLIKGQEVAFHDKAEDHKLTLDLNSDQNSQHTAGAQNELLAENLRLLYVALTRAQKYCYLIWGRFKAAETSALAYLLHSSRNQLDDINSKDSVVTLQSRVAAMKDEELLADLKQLVSRSDGTIELLPLSLEDEGEDYSHKPPEDQHFYRQFSEKIDTTWKISSYSYLISKRLPDEALPDRDAYHDSGRSVLPYQRDLPDFSDIFSFPRGTRAGIFFHDIFEHLDFASRDPEHQKNLVVEKLKAYGFDLKWQDPVCAMLKKVLAAPLQLENTSLTLSDVQDKDRINEMEFYFPLNALTPQKLQRIFKVHGNAEISTDFPEQIGKLSFPLSQGFMKGYIDLILHTNGSYVLLDWKSNFLGSRLEDYNQSALNQTMNNDYYILQYHLYVLALHQYLLKRVPGYRYETDFGGVFYFFIRGVDPVQGPDFGIYKDLPSPDIVNALGKALIPGF